MLIVKRKMNTIKQLGKGDNAGQRPLGITQLSKTSSSKMLLKMFLMSTYITTQLGCRAKKVWMPKRMVSQPLGSILQTNGGIGVPKMAFETIGQWNN
jgi:hypothetical protein